MDLSLLLKSFMLGLLSAKHVYASKTWFRTWVVLRTIILVVGLIASAICYVASAYLFIDSFSEEPAANSSVSSGLTPEKKAENDLRLAEIKQNGSGVSLEEFAKLKGIDLNPEPIVFASDKPEYKRQVSFEYFLAAVILMVLTCLSVILIEKTLIYLVKGPKS